MSATNESAEPSRPPASRAPRPAGQRGRAPLAVACLRAAALLVALTPPTLLVIASRLNPNSAGLGTHQQLGLPPCSLRLLAGIRCPSCGMTTSWAYFSRGQWIQSARVQPGGFLLAIFALGVSGLAVRTLILGRLPSLQTQRLVTVSAVAILLTTLVDWGLRLLV